MRFHWIHFSTHILTGRENHTQSDWLTSKSALEWKKIHRMWLNRSKSGAILPCIILSSIIQCIAVRIHRNRSSSHAGVGNQFRFVEQEVQEITKIFDFDRKTDKIVLSLGKSRSKLIEPRQSPRKSSPVSNRGMQKPLRNPQAIFCFPCLRQVKSARDRY